MTPYVDHRGLGGPVLGVTAVAFLIGELRQSVKSRTEAQKTDRYSGIVLRICVGVAWGITVAGKAALPAATIGGGVAIFVIGLGIALAGIALRWWAFHTLGRLFTVRVMTSPDQPVISAGPYRALRHPSYSGAELAFVGFAVMYGNWIGVAALTVLPLVGFARRIHVEEHTLNAALGDAYGSFAAGRKRMIPFVW